ncbi:MAG: TlpA family protein disulfide reductase [Betaproteobacteria bacterium]|jgi:thiol-disulfide isomerase/thioredoxin|nr:TlpA family protein disulfide reductase [Betaproteobacteria bacterium]NBS48222.1 TlpA family protein disulfide reductase [Betaproteobacteria bacterium]
MTDPNTARESRVNTGRTQRRQWLAAIAALPLASVAQTPAPRTAQAVPPVNGQTIALPPFTLISGETLAPSHFEGRTTVLYWWASWCPFCREQTPEMQKLWQRHAAQGLRFVGIAVDKQVDAARQYLVKGGYDFPCAWYGEALAAAFERPRGIPVTVVLDRSARVVMSARGQMFPEDVASISRWI